MRIEMGTVVPEKGTIVQLRPETVGYRGTLAMALRLELGSTHRAIKTAMRWTGASERTVEYWFAEERGPSGEHLIRLARHSDRVFRMVLIGAGRYDDADPEMRETIAGTRWRTCGRSRRCAAVRPGLRDRVDLALARISTMSVRLGGAFCAAPRGLPAGGVNPAMAARGARERAVARSREVAPGSALRSRHPQAVSGT
ncbi:hypothetical protein BYZ73_13675 [Rhodovulum viride]|uniref:XRE family transcriptional regulator n=1 Tax=Rhodovulum viride TaxID=1231134 RepID=A0ABX9DHL9_9RHOB|nr:hypothetical protein [Rhodovulum viride]RAP40807.1 hypothetical protein BYZ73_13675 [Rhodovulum viride]